MSALLVSEQIITALDARKPVVAMESALITHGFPYPANIEITRRMVDVVENEKTVAAVIGVYHGQPTVGLNNDQISEIAADIQAFKVSIRDLPLSEVRGGHGGTTVAATAFLAHKAGIKVFATGGIGGVHRGHPEDISADLPVLASTPVVVVCAGAKSILDLPRTLEYLETSGVPVVGFKTGEFPAFYSYSSGLSVDICVNHVREVADIYHLQREAGLSQGVLVTVPVPRHSSIPPAFIEPLITQALHDAENQNISGKALTPFILDRMVNLSESRTKLANESLLLNNVRVACQIAGELV
jgi:pseudouridine-5'-phosphate glycosidase